MTKRLSFFLFAALISVAPSAPPELIELKERKDVEKVAVLKPLYTSYLKALKRLETTYTQAGDLDNALEVRKEYESAAQQLASLKKITVKNGNAEATTSVGLYQTKLVSGSPWSFDFLDGGLIWFDKEGKLLIRDVLMREAYGTYKIEGDRMVLDTNTGDKIYLCSFEKEGTQIKASVADNKKKRTVLKPNASYSPKGRQREKEKFLKGGSKQ